MPFVLAVAAIKMVDRVPMFEKDRRQMVNWLDNWSPQQFEAIFSPNVQTIADDITILCKDVILHNPNPKEYRPENLAIRIEQQEVVNGRFWLHRSINGNWYELQDFMAKEAV